MSTRSLIFTLCLTLFYPFLNHSSALGQKQLAPLPIKEAFKTQNFPMFGKIDLSPDGRLVAYTLQDTNRKAQSTVFRSLLDLQRIGIPRGFDFCDIWITDIATGNADQLVTSLVP
jgi:hypothetical protein